MLCSVRFSSFSCDCFIISIMACPRLFFSGRRLRTFRVFFFSVLRRFCRPDRSFSGDYLVSFRFCDNAFMVCLFLVPGQTILLSHRFSPVPPPAYCGLLPLVQRNRTELAFIILQFVDSSVLGPLLRRWQASLLALPLSSMARPGPRSVFFGSYLTPFFSPRYFFSFCRTVFPFVVFWT